MNKASGLFIKTGHIQHFLPTLPASAKSLTDERDRKRGINPTVETLNDLNKQIQKLVVEDKRTKWQSTVKKCDHLTGILHLWRLIKGLGSKQGRPFHRQDLHRPQDDCQNFASQFTQPPIRLTGDKSKRQLKRQFHYLPLTETPAGTKEAIRLAKSYTAIGQHVWPTVVSELHDAVQRHSPFQVSQW